MRTAAIFAAAAAILPSVFAQRGASTISVTGIQDGTTGMRRELSELARDQDAFDLYLLAMDRYTKVDTNSLLSYYQISGIHGNPCQSYSGVGPNQQALNQGGCGYCTHSTPLFGPWHRAYLALYEQGFLEQVKGVISDFAGNPTQQAKFQAASKGFRIAYWDWAMGSGGVPAILSQQSVTVPSASGGSKTIANPLYSYKYQIFNDLSTGGSSPWTGWDHTLRFPTSSNSNAASNMGQMSSEFDAQFRNVQSLVYKMLLNCKSYTEMADDSAGTSSPDCAASLESIHGMIHVEIGGNGHMSYLDQAGFDPSFWLHHANVDRLLSIWQIAQGRQWYQGGSNGYPTWTHTGGQYAGGDFPLTPFYKNAGSKTFWTPNDLADWTIFGYSYPEVSGGLGTSRSNIISDINRLYGSQAVTPAPPISSRPASVRPSSSRGSVPSSSRAGSIPTSSGRAGQDTRPTSSAKNDLPSSRGSSRPTSSGKNGNGPEPSASGKPDGGDGGHDGGNDGGNDGGIGGGYLPSISISLPSLPSYLPDLDLPSYLPDLLTPLGRKWDWAANIVSERMGLGGSYSIYLFLGDVPKDASTWGSAKNLIGVHSIFASKMKSAEKGYLVSGSVSLTATLVEQIMGGNLKGLLPILVQPFLKQELHWAVKKCDGTVVPNDQVPGLQVVVVSSKMTPPSNANSAPVYDHAQDHSDVTQGDAGGSKPDSNPWGVGNGSYNSGSGSYNQGVDTGAGAGSGSGSDSGSWGSGSGSNAGAGSGSGSGSWGGGPAQPSCIPQVKYVYKYVTV